MPTSVTPAKAGVQKGLKRLDSGFRRNDTAGVCMRPKGLKLKRAKIEELVKSRKLTFFVIPAEAGIQQFQ